jgi:hypothetical protein
MFPMTPPFDFRFSIVVGIGGKYFASERYIEDFAELYCGKISAISAILCPAAAN